MSAAQGHAGVRRIAIAIGDPNGIGPEIAVRAAAAPPPGVAPILVGDEYTTGDGVQAFVVHGDMVISSPDAGSCEVIVRERLIERGRLFRAFIDCKRKNEASSAA